MPARGSITVNDRAATPLAHIFAPRGESNGVHLFSEAGSFPAGERTLTVSKVTSKVTGKTKTKMRIGYPIVVTEVINGISRLKVERTGWAEVLFTHEPLSLAQERKDLVGMVANALLPAVTVLDPVLQGNEDIW